MKVEQLMTRRVEVCRTDETLKRAAQLMWERDRGFIPVVKRNGAGALAGVLTDRDIAMATYIQGKVPAAIRIAQVMSDKLVTCRADNDIRQAETLMRDNKVRRLPVIDANGRLVGVLSLNDIAREVQREKGAGRRRELSAESLAATLASICEPPRLWGSSRIVDLEYVE